MTSPRSRDLTHDTLRADCSSCFALCCTALGFSRSSDFAVDKPAGIPCSNLASDFSCSIHESLPARGFRGCTVFDCFGAGQRVSQELFGGTSWADDPASKAPMFAAFGVTRLLHELQWYLVEANHRTFDDELASSAAAVHATIEQMIASPVEADLAPIQQRVRSLLIEVGDEVRSSFLATGDEHLDASIAPGADLIGRNLSGRSLRGADLRGAYLVGADLRNADLSGAVLLGADLRGALVGGADFARALFLTQTQLNATKGDRATRVPDILLRPDQWGG